MSSQSDEQIENFSPQIRIKLENKENFSDSKIALLQTEKKPDF